MKKPGKKDFGASTRPKKRILGLQRDPFFRAFSQLLKLRFTAMVTNSFSLVFPQFTSFHSIFFNILLKINKSFLAAFYTSFYYFMVFLFVLLSIEPSLEGFLRFWTNPYVQDNGPSWSPLRNYCAIITSYEVITL